jgi:hypothetical protein
MRGRSKFRFDWTTARVAEGTMWVECDDGKTIIARIGGEVMEAAARARPSGPIDDPAKVRLWIEAAIRHRYLADIAADGRTRTAPGDFRTITVEIDDFS